MRMRIIVEREKLAFGEADTWPSRCPELMALRNVAVMTRKKNGSQPLDIT